MTAASVPVTGSRRLLGLKPADTNEATMLTAGPERPVVVGVVISNNTSGAVAATLRWGDGSADHDIYAGKSIPANDSLVVELFLPLQEGWTIKVTSATGNALTFTLVLIEFGGMLGGEHGH